MGGGFVHLREFRRDRQGEVESFRPGPGSHEAEVGVRVVFVLDNEFRAAYEVVLRNGVVLRWWGESQYDVHCLVLFHQLLFQELHEALFRFRWEHGLAVVHGFSLGRHVEMHGLFLLAFGVLLALPHAGPRHSVLRIE